MITYFAGWFICSYCLGMALIKQCGRPISAGHQLLLGVLVSVLSLIWPLILLMWIRGVTDSLWFKEDDAR